MNNLKKKLTERLFPRISVSHWGEYVYLFVLAWPVMGMFRIYFWASRCNFERYGSV